jgi:hypothetical protein
MESHNFIESMRREEIYQERADDFYIKHLGATDIVRYNHNTASDIDIQRRDIDVSFRHKNKVLNISEKFREKDYNDLYIEFFSKFPTTRGWLDKSCADYIAYFFPERMFFIDEKKLASFYETYLLQTISINNFSELIAQNQQKNAIAKHRIKVKVHHYNIRIIQAYNKTKNTEWYTMGIAIPFKILTDFEIYFKEFKFAAKDL